MKSLYFADLHGHNYREFATLDENGVNSRLVDQVNVLDLIAESAREHKVDDIRFLGDLLHLKNNHDTLVLKTILMRIAMLAEEFPLLILPGNHDYRLWTSSPVVLKMLSEFADRILVVDKPMFIGKEEWLKMLPEYSELGEHENALKVYAEPYTRKVVELDERLMSLKREPNMIFLGHQDMIGMQYGGFTVEQGLDPKKLLASFKWSFVGHCHTPTMINSNTVSVGAPLQHNFSDVGVKKGWWIFDEEKDDLTFVQNNTSPRFYDITYTDNKLQVRGGTKELDYDKDFFRVKLSEGTLPEEVKKMRWKRISFEVAAKAKSRGDLKFSDSKESVVEKYVNLRGGDLDKKKLIEIGRRYV